jgi:hypothetical protein
MSSSERANGGADPILDRKGKGDKTTVRTNAGQPFGHGRFPNSHGATELNSSQTRTRSASWMTS